MYVKHVISLNTNTIIDMYLSILDWIDLCAYSVYYKNRALMYRCTVYTCTYM